MAIQPRLLEACKLTLSFSLPGSQLNEYEFIRLRSLTHTKYTIVVIMQRSSNSVT